MKKTACILLALLMLSAAATALAASVSYQDGKVTVSQEDGFFMILIDGENTGKWVGDGMPTVTFDYPLKEGVQHQLVLLSLSGDGNIGAMEAFWAEPAEAPVQESQGPVGLEDSGTDYVPFSPDPEAVSAAVSGVLLKDGGGAKAAYDVSYAGDENGAVLTLSVPEIGQAEDGVSLYLSDATLAHLKQIGFDHVSLAFGGAALRIELNAIRPSWFYTDKAIWYFVFSLAPLPENQWRVNLSAQTSVTETVTAGFYSGVSLIRDGSVSEIVLNGIY